MRATNPSHEWLGYFQGGGATPETATGMGALPSQVPAVRPMAVWGGRTGRRAIEFLATDETRMEHRFSKPVRAGIFVASPFTNGQSSVRSDIVGRADGRCRPDGAENYFGFGFYKYAAPNGAGDGATPETATGTGALPSQVPAGRPRAGRIGRTKD